MEFIAKQEARPFESWESQLLCGIQSKFNEDDVRVIVAEDDKLVVTVYSANYKIRTCAVYREGCHAYVVLHEEQQTFNEVVLNALKDSGITSIHLIGPPHSLGDIKFDKVSYQEYTN